MGREGFTTKEAAVELNHPGFIARTPRRLNRLFRCKTLIDICLSYDYGLNSLEKRLIHNLLY